MCNAPNVQSNIPVSVSPATPAATPRSAAVHVIHCTRFDPDRSSHRFCKRHVERRPHPRRRREHSLKIESMLNVIKTIRVSVSLRKSACTGTRTTKCPAVPGVREQSTSRSRTKGYAYEQPRGRRTHRTAGHPVRGQARASKAVEGFGVPAVRLYSEGRDSAAADGCTIPCHLAFVGKVHPADQVFHPHCSRETWNSHNHVKCEGMSA